MSANVNNAKKPISPQANLWGRIGQTAKTVSKVASHVDTANNFASAVLSGNVNSMVRASKDVAVALTQGTKFENLKLQKDKIAAHLANAFMGSSTMPKDLMLAAGRLLNVNSAAAKTLTGVAKIAEGVRDGSKKVGDMAQELPSELRPIFAMIAPTIEASLIQSPAQQQAIQKLAFGRPGQA